MLSSQFSRASFTWLLDLTYTVSTVCCLLLQSYIKKGMESTASASLDLAVEYRDYIIQAEEIKNPVLLDFFLTLM